MYTWYVSMDRPLLAVTCFVYKKLVRVPAFSYYASACGVRVHVSEGVFGDIEMFSNRGTCGSTVRGGMLCISLALIAE